MAFEPWKTFQSLWGTLDSISVDGLKNDYADQETCRTFQLLSNVANYHTLFAAYGNTQMGADALTVVTTIVGCFRSFLEQKESLETVLDRMNTLSNGFGSRVKEALKGRVDNCEELMLFEKVVRRICLIFSVAAQNGFSGNQ